MSEDRIVYVELVERTEVVIEKEIIKAVYSEREDIFRNLERFQVVLSEPTSGFIFKKVQGIYKGRFICSNDNCRQLKFNQSKNPKKQRKLSQSNESQYSSNHPSWLQWWKNKSSTIKPPLQYEKEETSEIKQKKHTKQKQTKPNKNDREFPQGQNHSNQQSDPNTENSRWSSSLTYVNFYYYSQPAPLEQLLEIYNGARKVKISIFIYVELLGQKCQKCMRAYEQEQSEYEPEYELPFFGKTELKRMRKNFSSYIYNKIFGRAIKRYRPCTLVELQDHKKQLCQACQNGTCKKQGERSSGRGRRS